MIHHTRSKKLCTAVGLLLSCGALVVAVQEAATRFGHFAYKEAAADALRAAGNYRATDRVVQLAVPAAEAFAKLRTAALADGVKLVPISGFRTVEYQRGLFNRAIERYGSELLGFFGPSIAGDERASGAPAPPDTAAAPASRQRAVAAPRAVIPRLPSRAGAAPAEEVANRRGS